MIYINIIVWTKAEINILVFLFLRMYLIYPRSVFFMYQTTAGGLHENLWPKGLSCGAWLRALLYWIRENGKSKSTGRSESEWKARNCEALSPGAALLIIATTLCPSKPPPPRLLSARMCVCLRTRFHIDSTGSTNKETLYPFRLICIIKGACDFFESQPFLETFNLSF